MSEKNNKGLEEAKKRTEDLFKLGYKELAKKLTGKTLRLAGRSTRGLVIGKVIPFGREQNRNPRYKDLLDVPSGRLAILPWTWTDTKKHQPTNLFLITSLDHGKPGALIQIEARSAEKLEKGHETVLFKNGIEIAEHLGAKSGDEFRIAFRDGSDDLFLYRSKEVIYSREKADTDLRALAMGM